MQYLLKTSKDEIVWLDALLSIGEGYSGSLTAHPIESGGMITDHFIQAPQSITFSAIISNYDFLINRTSTGNITGSSVRDVKEVEVTTIDSNSPGKLAKLIPEGISNLLSPVSPEIKMATGDVRQDEHTIKTFLKDVFDSREMLSLIAVNDSNGMSIDSEFSGMIITNIDFNETPDEDALIFNVTMEKPRFVSSRTAVVPLSVSRGLENIARQGKNKTEVGKGINYVEKGASESASKSIRENSVLKGLKDGVSDGLTEITDVGSTLIDRYF